jgi:TonB family protein
MKLLSFFIMLLTSWSALAQDTDIDVLDIRNSDIEVEQYWTLFREVKSGFPRIAKSSELSGCVLFSVTISSKGRAEDVELETAKPNRMFISAAKEVLRRMSWRPTEENESKTPIRMHKLVTFQYDRFSRIPDCTVD